MIALPPAIGIIGGSGLYELPGLSVRGDHQIETPFGTPSGNIVEGELGGRTVVFLPRHGKGHTIAPHEINHRANIWALRSLGVRWILSVAAVGSLRLEIQPRHAVLPDQFFDRLSRRENHTFFGGGIVAHIGFADPTTRLMCGILAKACAEAGVRCHEKGTYICMEGPAFSTRAESHAYRQIGGDIIGMTNLPEAKLAREAEMAFAALCMVTDYDCWKPDEDAVSTESVLAHLKANVESAKCILSLTIPHIPAEPDLPEHDALRTAIITPKDHWPDDIGKNLPWILDKYGL